MTTEQTDGNPIKNHQVLATRYDFDKETEQLTIKTTRQHRLPEWSGQNADP
ncbi:MAG: hypothetical protein JSV36_05125 [Anaerolineae bacterium]|nr:MAG: hypothetical protein JSV36_05125 [Anaerolineae bacterium]